MMAVGYGTVSSSSGEVLMSYLGTVLSVGRCTAKRWVLICGDIRDSVTALRKLLTGIGYCRSEGYKYDIFSPAGASHTVLVLSSERERNVADCCTSNTEPHSSSSFTPENFTTAISPASAGRLTPRSCPPAGWLSQALSELLSIGD